MSSVCPKFFVKPFVYLAYFPQSGVALACRGTDLQDLCVNTIYLLAASSALLVFILSLCMSGMKLRVSA